MAIELTDITKRFGSFSAITGVSLEVRDGEFLALLGPSGSGKTTLLRIIAGLEFPDSGTIRFRGEDIAGRKARERKVGLVFQHYALFRHMTVFENVAFGLRVKPRHQRPANAAIRDRVMRLLALVQLGNLASRYPGQLSGGQRQRVALARALAIEPEVLLLDEPFGALDAKVRKELRRWLRRLHDDMALTSIFVTHDQEEALELADRVVVMRQGGIEQIGTPGEIYEDPATPYVYEFIGNANRFDCRVEAGQLVIAGQVVAPLNGVAPADGPAIAFVRPHDFALLASGTTPGLGAVVRHAFSVGAVRRVELEVATLDRLIEAELPLGGEGPALAVGQPVVLRPRAVKVFPAAPG